MLPDNTLSEITVELNFLLPRKPSKLIDYEWGGVDLNDPTEGLFVKIWTVYYEGGVIKVSSETNTPTDIITAADVSEVSLSFDQNMRPTICYVENNIVKLYWYDSSVGSQVTTSFDNTYLSPRISLDDGRDNLTNSSDVLFCYVRNNNLYMRVQRERFLTEHLLKEGGVGNLIQVGMTTSLRFQFEYTTETINYTEEYPEAAWVSRFGSQFPSKSVWLYKELVGVDKDSSVDREQYPLINFYSQINEDDVALGGGKTMSGEWIHTTLSLYWLESTIQRNLFSLLKSNEKISRTKSGLELFVSKLKDVLKASIELNVITNFEILSSSLTEDGSVSIKFRATLESAIVEADVVGEVYL